MQCKAGAMADMGPAAGLDLRAQYRGRGVGMGLLKRATKSAQILVIGAIGLSLASDFSVAQVAGDNDVYAAYCVGVFAGMIAPTKKRRRALMRPYFFSAPLSVNSI